jgi:FMN phosphatase YigB (HAD superfamily)
MTQKYLFEHKKLHIFDLDDTLYLRQLTSYEDEIRSRINMKIMLEELKKDGKILAMASHNTNPRYCLNQMQCSHLFDIVIGEYPRPKDSMIREILEKTGCNKEEAVFYDDMEYNIKLVSQMGIDVYHVKTKYGIILNQETQENIDKEWPALGNAVYTKGVYEIN